MGGDRLRRVRGRLPAARRPHGRPRRAPHGARRAASRVLAAASLVGGLAPSLEVLVGARAAQGLGAALAAPNALAILSRTFEEGPERHRALGIFGAAGGTAAAGSSVLSGVIVQGPGWPWAFFLNVPVGLVLGRADPATTCPPTRRAASARSTDLRGALDADRGPDGDRLRRAPQHRGGLAGREHAGGAARRARAARALRPQRGPQRGAADPARDAAQALGRARQPRRRRCCGRASSA